MKNIISRLKNIDLSQSNVTNIMRISYLYTITFMVLLLLMIYNAVTANLSVIDHRQTVDEFVDNFIEQKSKLDKYALLCAQTNDIAYLNRYIEVSSEIYEISDMIRVLEETGITAEEKTLLQNAFREIDNTIASDMYAINLIYLSYNKTLDGAHEFQKKFPLKEDAYNLNPINKQALASELILEGFREGQGKHNAMFFQEFDETISKRLDDIIAESRSNVSITMLFMLIYALSTLILLLSTLKLIDLYISKPIMRYTRILDNMDSPEAFVQKLTPSGTKELVILANIINNSNRRMNTLLRVYAYGSSIADNFEDTLTKILTLIKSEYNFDSVLLIDIHDKHKYKLYTTNGYTNKFDAKISKAYAIPFLLKRLRNLNYVHIKASSFKGEPAYQLFNEFGYLSLFAFPLKSRDKNKRVMAVLSKNEDPLDNGVVALLALIAQHMSIVFENLKLYGSLYQQLQDRVQAQSEMKKAKDEAEKANTAKTHFLANISHEIRTPLTSILGYSDILSTMINDEKQLGYIKTINNAGNLLLQLINDVLDMSKIEAGMMIVQYHSFNPRVVFREVAQLLHTKVLAKGIDFIVEIDESIPEFIILSEIYLRQVLINLLGNAVKFTATGYVKLKANAQFHFPDKKELFDLTIDIIDTGIGVERDSLQKIFEPFTQQSGKNTRKYEGSGLGLAISKNLVNVMDGTLSVVSKPGEGSTFTIKINNVFVADSEGATLPVEYEEDIVFENSIAAVDEWLSGYTVLKDILQKLGVTVIPLQSLYELTEASAEIYPGIVVVDSDDDAISSKYKSIMSFTIFKNAYILFVKKAGTKKEVFDDYAIDDFISRPFAIAEIRKTLKKYLYFSKAVRQDTRSTVANFEDANVKYELKQIVLTEYVSKIEGFYGAIRLSSVLDFAQQLESDGAEYSCEHLSELGRQLKKSANNYNMSDIRQDLNKIGEFIGYVKGLSL